MFHLHGLKFGRDRKEGFEKRRRGIRLIPSYKVSILSL